MSLSLLIVIIILSAIASLVMLILSIVHLSTGKSRSGMILGVSFLMVVILMILSIMETVRMGTQKIKNGVEWIRHLDKDKVEYKDQELKDSASCYGFIPASFQHKIKDDFLVEKQNGRYVIPLVYPYRFLSGDDFLMNDCGIENLESVKDSCVLQIHHITDFTFDKNILIAKRDNVSMMEEEDRSEDLPDYTYFVLEFSSGRCLSFMNEKKAMEKAESMGYTGPDYLESNYTHYWNYKGERE